MILSKFISLASDSLSVHWLIKSIAFCFVCLFDTTAFSKESLHTMSQFPKQWQTLCSIGGVCLVSTPHTVVASIYGGPSEPWGGLELREARNSRALKLFLMLWRCYSQWFRLWVKCIKKYFPSCPTLSFLAPPPTPWLSPVLVLTFGVISHPQFLHPLGSTP